MAHEQDQSISRDQYLARGINLTTPEEVIRHSKATLNLLGDETDRPDLQGSKTSNLLYRVAALFSILLRNYEANTCEHSIVDARNPIIRSGYLCTKCGALFRAGDHV